MNASDADPAMRTDTRIPRPRRGLLDRPSMPDHLEREIATRFGLSATQPLVDIGGSATLNLRLATTDGTFVVRVYRSWVTPARLQAMQGARRHLAEAGIPCLPPLPARDGSDWIDVGGHLVEIEPHVSFDGKMDTWERLEEGLPLLGHIHDLLELLDLPLEGRIAAAANSIDRELFVAGVRAGARSLREIHPPDDELAVADASESLAERIAALERPLDLGPPQIVHGDYWDNNVYFRDGRIVLVLDLDFMGARPRVDDLALTLYYTNSTFSDDQVSGDRIRRLGRLAHAYDSALARPLTDDEWRAIPLAMARTAVGMVAHLADADSEEGMFVHTRSLAPDFTWVRALLDDLERWQRVMRMPDRQR